MLTLKLKVRKPISPTIRAAALFVGLLSLSGCITVTDDRACKDNTGSCAHLETKTFCDIDGVYSGTEAPNECVTPPSPDACNRVVACDDQAKPYCNDDSMGTCVECTQSSHCTVEGENCNTNKGECIDGEVVECTPGAAGDATCADANVGLDYCSDGEICAACLVDEHCTEFANAGICDDTAFECRACDADGDDCDSGLCGTRDNGVCVPENDVIYVATTGSDVNGCGAIGSECATIVHAVDNEVSGARNIIVVTAGTYDGALVFTDKSATLIANGEVIIKAQLLAEGNTVIDIAGTSEVVFDGINVEPAAAIPNTDLVTCLGSTASLSLLNSTIRSSQGLGLRSTCSLTIASSIISGNQGGGIDVSGGTYSITNNFIVENGDSGGSGSARGGVSLDSASAGIFSFNTLSGNNIRTGALLGAGLSCSGAEVLASSNIIVGGMGGAGLIAGNCTLSYSLTDLPANGTNITGDPLFVSPALVDYHLQSGSPCTDKAEPGTSVTVDIDDQERPLGDAPDIGADEVE